CHKTRPPPLQIKMDLKKAITESFQVCKSSARRLDDLPQADLSIRPVYQIRPRSDRHTRPPDQITPPDHRPPSLTTQASSHHSIPNLLKWYRSDGPCWTKPDNDDNDNDDDDDDGDGDDDDHDDRLH
ncbi:unnamed protein product, partial [Porites evermanni]